MGIEGTIGRDQELWNRINNVEFDLPEALLDFTARLARENGWSRNYADRAVQEYRRFAYIAVMAPHEVTPSDEVDQVWHLHLTYSRHYWGPWTEALGRKLHHGPTNGGSDEAARFEKNYQATLESYFQVFGEEPPIDLWPDPGERFEVTPRMRRVNVGRYLLVSKPAIAKFFHIAAMFYVALYLLGPQAGAAGAWAKNSVVGGLLDWAGNFGFFICLAILFFGVTGMIGAGLSHMWRRVRGPRKRRKRDGTWSFVHETGGDGDGDGGCGGCG